MEGTFCLQIGLVPGRPSRFCSQNRDHREAKELKSGNGKEYQIQNKFGKGT